MLKDLKTAAAGLLILVFAAAVLTAGCTGSQESTPATQTPVYATEETAEMTVAPSDTPAPAPEEEKNSFSGEGPGNFTLPAGVGVHLLTFEQDTPLESEVSVQTDKDYIMLGNKFAGKISESDTVDGKYVWTQAFLLTDDKDAEFSVKTDSKWTLSLSFPQMINGIPPQTFTGKGNLATPFFQINKGDYKFTIKTENNSEVEVHLMDYYGNPVMDGKSEMPLAFHEGIYDGDITVTIPESENYLINVVCDGDWTVSVEQA